MHRMESRLQSHRPFLKKRRTTVSPKSSKEIRKRNFSRSNRSFQDRDYYYNPVVFNLLCSPYPDFRIADTLFVGNGENLYYKWVHLTDLNNPVPYWKIESDKLFRFSEIHFYDWRGNALRPVLYKGEECRVDFNTLFDDNLQTCVPVYDRLVMNFKPNAFIDRIDIAGFSDGKSILSGHTYELQLFRNGQWKELQSYTAKQIVGI